MQGAAATIAKRVSALALTHPVRIAVDGFCGAGKSTFADLLAGELRDANRPIIRASADDFLNPPEIRYQMGRTSPLGFFRHAVDLHGLREHLLAPLGSCGSFRYRTFTIDRSKSAQRQSPLLLADRSSLLIVDGLFLLMPQMQPYWDYSVFIDTPFDTCLARAIPRNQEQFGGPEAVVARYRDRYVPGFQLYLDQVNPKAHADCVVDNAGPKS